MSVKTLLTASRAIVCGSAPSYSAGYAIVPTPMMKPWPGMRRGTEWTVPIIPGFVIVAVVPAKSSGASLFVRTLRIRSSYAAKNPAKSSSSASLDVRHEQRT